MAPSGRVDARSTHKGEQTCALERNGTILLNGSRLVGKDSDMSDHIPPFPLVYDGLDAPEKRSAVDTVVDAARGTAHTVRAAVEAGRRPGMPLSVLSNVAKEAPLASLLIAFLLGVAVARRR